MDDLAFFGVGKDEAEEWVGALEEETVFEVWEENWLTVNVFLAMATQWNIVVGTGVAYRQGLRYEALPPVLDLMRVPNKERSDVFSGLRIMEAAAKEIFESEN